MIKKYITILIFLFITLCAQSQCRYYNKVDENGKKTGLWLVYWDREKTILSRKFHYTNDRESGICKLYNRDGKRISKERHFKNRIKIKSFNEEGKIQRKGWANIDFNEEGIHFYWNGHWKFYGDKHRLNGISVYQNGTFIKSIENKRVIKNKSLTDE